jgi:hypothetical protein
MFYIKFNGGLPADISPDLPKGAPRGSKNGWVTSRDAETFEQASTWSKYLTAMTGKTYLSYDQGPSHYPRYGVIEAPAVDDPVSYGFNGDYYPCGTITRITKGWRVTTSEGKVFNRYKETAGWKMVGGTWGMVAGHVDERNPHF